MFTYTLKGPNRALTFTEAKKKGLKPEQLQISLDEFLRGETLSTEGQATLDEFNFGEGAR